jgi:glycosyltransferase involved in cell wall biosynthesis
VPQVRALVVTNMWPSPERPAYGAFVRDQVEALQRVADVEVEVFSFPPKAYARAARDLRRAHGPSVHGRFDVIHAHFGLTAWVALAVRGAPRIGHAARHGRRPSRTGRLTRMILPRMDLVATVSEALQAQLGPAWAGRTAVLPTGVATDRFRPVGRARARRTLGLDPDEPCLLFPADPARPKKRHDRAMEVAAGVRLLSIGGVAPAQVPLWVNAANAVLVPSESEGFGLAVLEALACDVRSWRPPSASTRRRWPASGARSAPPSTRTRGAPRGAAPAPPGPARRGRERRRWRRGPDGPRVVDAWRSSCPRGTGLAADGPPDPG